MWDIYIYYAISISGRGHHNWKKHAFKKEAHAFQVMVSIRPAYVCVDTCCTTKSSVALSFADWQQTYRATQSSSINSTTHLQVEVIWDIHLLHQPHQLLDLSWLLDWFHFDIAKPKDRRM